MQPFNLENHLQAKDKYTGTVTAYGKTKIMQLQLSAGQVIPAHQTDADVLIIVQKGRVVFEFQGEQVQLAPDKLLHISPGETHSVHALDDVEALLIRTEK